MAFSVPHPIKNLSGKEESEEEVQEKCLGLIKEFVFNVMVIGG